MKNTRTYFKVAGNYFFAILFLTIVFTACEKVEKPYLPMPAPPNPPANDTVRKILVEEYTGHRCLNCPHAAEAIHTAQEYHPNQIIVLAIHPTNAGANNTGPTTTDGFIYDFRNTVGDKYFTDFKIPFAIPQIVVNRKINSSTGLYVVDSYQNVKTNNIDTLNFKMDPLVYIKISNTYDLSTKQLQANITTMCRHTLAGNYKLVVLLTQDSIIAPQKKDALVIKEYNHKHVLRACIDGSDGSGNAMASIIKGANYSFNYNYPIPDMYKNIPVDPQHCNVLAFIYNEATKEVIQVQEGKIIK